MSKDNNISRRKALAAIAATGAAASIGGAGTYSYITDNETAEISFQAGSIVLKISPKTIDFTSESLAAGTPTAEDNEQDDGSEMKTTITVTNAGTLPVGRLRLDGLNLGGTADLRAGAEITTMDVVYPNGDTESILSSTRSAVDSDLSDGTAGNNPDGTDIFDLQDLATSVNTGGGGIALLRAGDTLARMEGNDFQLTIGVTFDYSQVTNNGGTLSADPTFWASQPQN